jgi:U4/U6 small nuclear ribonucleoprotein PRP3
MGNATAESSQDKNEKRRERDRYKTMAPKFSTVRANQAAVVPTATAKPVVVTAVVTNPYAPTPASSSTANGAGNGEEERIAAPRRSRKMNFAPAGKFVQQGDVLRNELKMEALRQRIAEASKKAGLDSEFDTLEKSLKVSDSLLILAGLSLWVQRQPPPEVEWWDKAILPDGANYDDIEATMVYITTTEEPSITHLIQHPIPILAPSDKKQVTRDLMLTKKEQKKMRRQRRQAELEDKRDRQKMGLLPPDAPKVRLANLMKVLTSDAVQDPTKVEAKVRKEVAMRAYKHEKDNKERKLTVEERKTKEYKNMIARERKGIYGAAFK